MIHDDDAILSTRTLFAGWMTLLLARVRLSGTEHERAFLLHPSGAQVLAYDPARGVAMVGRQTRLGVLHLGLPPLIEGLGGAEDEGEAPVVTVLREAMEEAGLRLRDPVKVGHAWMTPSTSTERVHLFLAEYDAADRVAPGGGAAGEVEAIDLTEMPLADLWAASQAGVFDAKLLLLVQALRIRRPELF